MVDFLRHLKPLLNSLVKARQVAAPTSLKLIESIEFAEISGPERVYAIGDIHGMGELLLSLLSEIDSDLRSHKFTTYLILLGDYVDRGPETREVIESLVQLSVALNPSFIPIFLKGNHEQMLLDFIYDPVKHGEFWLKNGGDATLSSYGVFLQGKPNSKQLTYLRDELTNRMPSSHLEFLKSLRSHFSLGDYFFCHAGIRVGLPLAQQSDDVLLWTRIQPQPSDGAQEKIIVHGHEPVREPVMAQFHINVDTGAFVTGRLTALKLQGALRSFISVRGKVNYDNRTISKRQVQDAR